MKKLLQIIKDRRSTGFSVLEKVVALLIGVAYFGSPLDVVPDALPPLTWLDDAFVIYWVVQILKSPTLKSPPPGDGGAGAGQQMVHVNPAEGE
jgi:hypothetical protein